ncbi:MAG TPA: sigma-70 family RNA polymerase sigma factor, partial [Bacteroidetes bacterium]|nr:sigma-70 family RNA polymerase sigma factor [Bacteroidota bacterium]
MSVSPTLLDQTLAAQGEALVAYVRQRLGPEAAQDVVQDALLRLAERAPELDDQADLTR